MSNQHVLQQIYSACGQCSIQFRQFSVPKSTYVNKFAKNMFLQIISINFCKESAQREEGKDGKLNKAQFLFAAIGLTQSINIYMYHNRL
jgi:hypothetical protein